MKHVYGPVPSRRLGQSLGIDPIPLKTCNWNCVYCQLGRTRPLTRGRAPYHPAAEILAQVREALAAHDPGDIDWVTFVGSGEPTLHEELGWMIRKVKDLTQIPVAVITNGSLLHLAEVRDDLAQADAVLPSLDAASAELYRKINRPDPAIPLELHLRGLIEFRHEYDGAYWPEVMLLRDLNDSEHALAELGAQLRNLAPDEVHLNTPSRPAAEDWVKPADEEGLLRAKALLGEVVRVVLPAGGTFDLGGSEGVVDALIAILSRHPMREEELRQTLAAWAPDEITSALAQLAACGQAQIITRYGTRFWSAAAAFYPDACS